MNDRVLVTGASGFVGARLVKALRAEGRDVLVPAREALDVAADRFPEVRVDQVIHLAARTFVPDSWREPEAFYRVNAQGTVNVLGYCRRIDAPLVFVSAYCYGTPSSLPIAESAPLRPNNPYALSKCAAEKACRFYAEHFDTRVTILRPFNLYGPGQASHFLVPRIVDQALDDSHSQIVVEDDTPRRDYVHVDDLVAAIRLICAASGPPAIYNVGSGASHSVAEIADIVLSIAGVDKPVVSRGNRRPNEIADVVADISAIRRLGWSPAIRLADGLADAIARRRASGTLV